MASLLLTDPQRDAVFNAIVETANDVVLPRFQNLGDGEIDTKTSPTDLVTIADREAEARLTTALTAILPGSVVVGEEAVSADPQVLDAIAGEAPVWIVDPVDGTRNFAAGQTPFCVMVGLAVAGVPVGAWIWRPIDAEMIVAFRDEGAQLFETATGHDRRLRVTRPLAASEMNGFVSFKYLTEEQRASPAAMPAACDASSRSAARGRNICASQRVETILPYSDGSTPGITARGA